jgi:hypothetical protein
MFIRATRVQTPPDKLQEAIENFETNTVKRFRATPGNVGVFLMVNRETGAGLGVTYWESAKALAASEQVGVEGRTQAIRTVPGTQIVNVDRAEVMIMDRTGAPQTGTFSRLVLVNADPEKVDAAVQHIRNHTLPILKTLKGYRATIVTIDRTLGRLSASTVWASKADLDASESKIAGPRAEAAKIAGAGPHDVSVEIFESVVVSMSESAVQATTTA